MGLFKKHTPGMVIAFDRVVEHGQQETENEFRDHLNLIINAVAKDDTYSINEKLKIYERMSQLSNCLPKERRKYAKKVHNALK